jgi:outer membrane protein TolC
MKNIKTLFLSFLFLPVIVSAQPTVLGLEDFYTIVQEYHPIAKQANLLNERGRLTVSQARGSFDPKIVSEFERKNFDGKNYFNLWDSYVQIPTLLNVDVKAGFERNYGTYLNPENTVPTDGLYYAGVSVPLGQGLIHNERNINLKKSQYQNLAFQNDADNVLNNLFLDANYVYWWWYENYKKREAVQTNLRLIKERFEGVRLGALNGESAAIDSVEMLIQVQNWSNNLMDAELNLQNSYLLLQNFIWNDSIQAPSLSPSMELEDQLINIDEYLDWAMVHHPQLKELNIESDILELDRKLTSEMLKPIFDVNYNLLLSGQEEVQSSYFTNNYKLGVDFVFPLLIRKERAKLKIVKIKQQEYGYKIDQKSRVIINKIQQNYNKVFTLQEMISQQERMLLNYEKLLQAEQSKFNNGESSVFLLNSRENKKLQGQIKLIELEAKYNRSIGELKWSTGNLYDEIIN